MKAKKASSKKFIQQQVINRLGELEDLKNILGEKKFKKRIKKATKLLTARLPKKDSSKKGKSSLSTETPFVREMNQPATKQEAAAN